MINIGLGQLNTQDKKQDNLASAGKLINELAAKGAGLIMLPEYFNFLGPDELKGENAEPIDDSRSLELIRKKARDLKVYIHIGSYLERDGNHVYNTGVVFDPAGEILAKYRKIHLFDVEIPGGIVHLESATVTAGDRVTTFNIGDMKFGMSTCYDLRFPEMFRSLSDQGVQIIL
jgi:predicted amidohydrolase